MDLNDASLILRISQYVIIFPDVTVQAIWKLEQATATSDETRAIVSYVNIRMVKGMLVTLQYVNTRQTNLATLMCIKINSKKKSLEVINITRPCHLRTEILEPVSSFYDRYNS